MHFPGKKVLLFNPRAANHKPRIPNSILSMASVLEGRHDYVIVDGNREEDPWRRIKTYLDSGEFGFFACTVMPGPQLRQAIPFSKRIKREYPRMRIVWGGYFASNQCSVVLQSGYVDVVVHGQGERAFPRLLDALAGGENLSGIPHLAFLAGGKLVKTQQEEIYEPDDLPGLPYEQLNSFYPVSGYLGKTCLGTKTIAYHSSMGCPFTCSFCAVVPLYKARWKGKSAERIYRDIRYLKERFGGNAIEFHDNNFFVSEKRTVDFARLMLKEDITWWGEGRIDTIDKYSDESIALMRDSGCRMIFFGAETGNDEVLKRMDKGGTQSAAQIMKFAVRMKNFGIIPEYSFVLGMPGNSEEEVWKQIRDDVTFIRRVKEANPDAEIIIYVYSPVPVEGSELYKQVQESGFHFPNNLEEWIRPSWENFDLRKNPLTPWLTPAMVDYIRNFETVLNGRYPTVSDIRLSPGKARALKTLSALRYKNRFYSAPYEIKLLQKWWKYRQPETEGFYSVKIGEIGGKKYLPQRSRGPESNIKSCLEAIGYRIAEKATRLPL